ncbi:putative peptidoglycan lipid II flippase [Verrucomicrobium sp. GAS474]|uniref:murein biosynthesis integral membrane protein MurJ n=1 Tax=Verrucomicrobium sp. GAS474 TaxID=1882831 RepID=UPI00087A26F4|nr:murein biosynthesis integral membrane protein MurJ [Verrucomicrobium sp. GAS474]SDT87858.1 putative peptidoglycan lipid II flippase [Verrucomicrobium sp. GAS474]
MSDAPPPPPTPPPGYQPTGTRRAAGIVGLAVIVSRFFGVIREQIFAAMFGGGKLLDAYLAAFQIPNLLRDLFAEGALSTAFTTLFTRTWEKEGPPPAWLLANLIFSAALFFLGGICLLGIIDAPLIVEMTSHGFHAVPGKFELTVNLTRLLFPFILFVSLASVAMGMLNARFVFGLPASASTVFNIVSVAGGIAGAYACDPVARENWAHPHFSERALYGLCLGVLLGGFAQLAIQIPGLVKIGYRFKWTLNPGHPRLREVWSLMWPSVIAGAAVQINVLVNGQFASQIDGGRSWLNCAFRLMQFPIGVFGVSLATATLPAISRAFARDDMAGFGQTARNSLRLAFFLTIPSAVGLAVLAEPIIRLIYQHLHFTARDTAQTAAALQAYSIGLSGYAAIKILVPCFYALGERTMPLRVSLIGIGANLVLNLAAIKILHFGHAGLALTTSCVALLNFGQLFLALRKRIDIGPAVEWTGFLLRVLAAAALCGLGAWAAEHFTAGWQNEPLGKLDTVWRGAFCLFLALSTGVTAYGLGSILFGLHEFHEAAALIKRKLKRKK